MFPDISKFEYSYSAEIFTFVRHWIMNEYIWGLRDKQFDKDPVILNLA